jgi:hypothetical protein
MSSTSRGYHREAFDADKLAGDGLHELEVIVLIVFRHAKHDRAGFDVDLLAFLEGKMRTDFEEDAPGAHSRTQGGGW